MKKKEEARREIFDNIHFGSGCNNLCNYLLFCCSNSQMLDKTNNVQLFVQIAKTQTGNKQNNKNRKRKNKKKNAQQRNNSFFN